MTNKQVTLLLKIAKYIMRRQGYNRELAEAIKAIEDDYAEAERLVKLAKKGV